MKQLLVTLVAVALGIIAMSSYAEADHKQRQGAKSVPVFSEENQERLRVFPRTARTAEEHQSEVNEDGSRFPVTVTPPG